MDCDRFLSEFCAADADRKNILLRELTNLGLVNRVLSLEGADHILVDPPVRSRPGARPLVLISHYDRIPGTPGANDNSASVLNLLLLLERMKMLGERALWPEVRVIFSDREEVHGTMSFRDQGAYSLGLFLKKTRLSGAFFCVLDMTGIGDTVVMGKGAMPHLVRAGIEPDETYRALYAVQRIMTKKVLSNLDEGFFLEIDTPFSDDLGLFLAGIVASQISLLPRKEANLYQRSKFNELPLTWQTMHTSEDKVDRLWEKSRRVVADLLDHLLAYPFPHI